VGPRNRSVISVEEPATRDESPRSLIVRADCCHILWPTIQCRSLTICPPHHSPGRGDKRQCDEKQPRHQASAPLSRERLTLNLRQIHSNNLPMWTSLLKLGPG